MSGRAARSDHVGNDVVDLEDPAIERSHLRERFVARVCTPAEALRVRDSAAPKLALWTLFAAKEAAYKACMKLEPRVRFLPRDFAVAADGSAVEHAVGRFFLRVITAPGYVHAMAHSAPTPLLAEVRAITDVRQASAEARRLACELAASRYALDLEELSIERARDESAWDGYAPPVLRAKGQPLGLDVSLSHDGRFVACVLSARAMPQPEARACFSSSASSAID